MARFLTAEWRYLAMLNYEVEPSVVAALVPAGTELDAWGGKTFVSVVGFRFLATRVLGIGIPLHRDFDEVNLRFYVRRSGPEGWRRGVVFVKEIVPRAAIAWVARALYNERYVALPMRHEVALDAAGAPGRVRYEWRTDGRWNHLAVAVRGEPAVPAEGSEESFITEHYWGYARQRHGGTVEYRVEHPPWRVWAGADPALDCDVAPLYGASFAPYLAGRPSSVFVADGSAVVVHRGERL
jgi:uncharacterized protein